MKYRLFALIMMVLLITSAYAYIISPGYVTGKYSLYCYVKGHENKNIKHKQHFRTLEACGKPFKQTL